MFTKNVTNNENYENIFPHINAIPDNANIQITVIHIVIMLPFIADTTNNTASAIIAEITVINATNSILSFIVLFFLWFCGFVVNYFCMS